MDDNDGCYVVLGGDFNVDFGRIGVIRLHSDHSAPA